MFAEKPPLPEATKPTPPKRDRSREPEAGRQTLEPDPPVAMIADEDRCRAEDERNGGRRAPLDAVEEADLVDVKIRAAAIRI